MKEAVYQTFITYIMLKGCLVEPTYISQAIDYQVPELAICHMVHLYDENHII